MEPRQNQADKLLQIYCYQDGPFGNVPHSSYFILILWFGIFLSPYPLHPCDVLCTELWFLTWLDSGVISSQF